MRKKNKTMKKFNEINRIIHRSHEQVKEKLKAEVKRICDKKKITFHSSGTFCFYLTDKTTIENDWHSDYVDNINDEFEDSETNEFLTEVFKLPSDFQILPYSYEDGVFIY